MSRTEVHPLPDRDDRWLLRTTVRQTPAIRLLAGARARPTELQRVAEWTVPATVELARQLKTTLPDARWTKAAAGHRKMLAEQRKYRVRLQTRGAEPAHLDTPSGPQTLASFQANGADWLFGESGILADDMGLGKTVQLVTAAEQMDRLMGRLDVLVICPTAAISVWFQHLQDWTTIKPFIFHGPRRKKEYEAYQAYEGAKALISSQGLVDRHSDAVNYGSIAKEGKAGEFNEHYDLLILDEAHKLGVDPGGKRVRTTVSITRNCDRVWVSTGTPVNDSPRDLWVLMHYVNPLVFGSYQSFCDRYCIVRDRQWRVENLGLHPDLEDEYEWIIKPWMLRRLKKTHGANIPDARPAQVIELQMTGPQAKAYRQLVDAGLTLLDQDDGSKKLAFARGNLPKQGLLQYVAAGVPEIEDGRVLSLQTKNSNKLAYLIDVATERRGDPFVVYAYSSKEVQMYAHGLTEAGFSVGTIIGKGNNPAKKAAVVKLFQEGELDVIIVTNAGGDSITLTAADLVVLTRPSWRPLDNQQVMDRINRWGQTREPMAQILASVDTVDMTRLAALAGKIEIQGEMTLDKKRLKSLLTGKV